MNIKELPAVLAVAFAFASLVAASPAAADDYDTLRSECGKQLRLSPSGCECIVNSARAQLSDQERELVVAHVTRDPNAMAKQQGMTRDSAMRVMNFMVNAPQTCATQ
jgi:hypothetical protein